jgi:hypothetical protein
MGGNLALLFSCNFAALDMTTPPAHSYAHTLSLLDDSDVTLNVCLGREFEGAGLTFCGSMGAPGLANPTPETLHPKPYTRNPRTLNPQPSTLNPQPSKPLNGD